MRQVIGNCLIYALWIRFITPDSKLYMYYNRKHKVVSFYVIIDEKYKITFKRDKTKPVYIKNLLFHIKPVKIALK
jgi:hypothetical protein